MDHCSATPQAQPTVARCLEGTRREARSSQAQVQAQHCLEIIRAKPAFSVILSPKAHFSLLATRCSETSQASFPSQKMPRTETTRATRQATGGTRTKTNPQHWTWKTNRPSVARSPKYSKRKSPSSNRSRQLRPRRTAVLVESPYNEVLSAMTQRPLYTKSYSRTTLARFYTTPTFQVPWESCVKSRRRLTRTN